MILLEWLGGIWLLVLAATFGLVPGTAVRFLGARSLPCQVQPYLILAALTVEYLLCESLRFGFGAAGGPLLVALMAGTVWGWWRSRLGFEAESLEERSARNADLLEVVCVALGRS